MSVAARPPRPRRCQRRADHRDRDVTKHFSAGRDGLGRARPSLKAVDGVSLSIQRGETLALVGETGSGKTTFGRLLLGLYRPTSGDILYRGQSILDPKARPRARCAARCRACSRTRTRR